MRRGRNSGATPRVLTACCLIVGCLTITGDAADTTGELHGAVVDDQGAGLSGVRVSLSSDVLIGGVLHHFRSEDL